MTGKVWKNQFTMNGVNGSVKKAKQANALGHAIRVHLHASGVVVREVRRPVMVALQKLLKHKFKKNYNNINEPFRTVPGWNPPKPNTSAFNALLLEAPKTRNPKSLAAAIQLYDLLSRQVRALCPLGQGNSVALANRFSNNSLTGADDESVMYIVLEYDAQGRRVVAKGVAVVQPAQADNYADSDLQRMASTGRLAEVSLVCGKGGGGELALLAALSKVAVAKQRGSLRYSGVTVEAAFRGEYTNASRNWQTDKSIVPIGPTLAAYKFNRIAANKLAANSNQNRIEVMAKGDNWRQNILEALLTKRYGGQGSMESICPITTGQGLTYCF